MTDTGHIDINHEDANMYGCQPCPKCDSIYRIPYGPTSFAGRQYQGQTGQLAPEGVIHCEGCGFIEPITGAAL